MAYAAGYCDKVWAGSRRSGLRAVRRNMLSLN